MQGLTCCCRCGYSVIRRRDANSVATIRTALHFLHAVVVHEAFIDIGRTKWLKRRKDWARPLFVCNKIKERTSLKFQNSYHTKLYSEAGNLITRAFLRRGEGVREKTLTSADRVTVKRPVKLSVINKHIIISRLNTGRACVPSTIWYILCWGPVSQMHEFINSFDHSYLMKLDLSTQPCTYYGRLSSFRIPALPSAASKTAVGPIRTLIIIITSVLQSHVTCRGFCGDGALFFRVCNCRDYASSSVFFFLFINIIDNSPSCITWQ